MEPLPPRDLFERALPAIVSGMPVEVAAPALALVRAQLPALLHPTSAPSTIHTVVGALMDAGHPLLAKDAAALLAAFPQDTFESRNLKPLDPTWDGPACVEAADLMAAFYALTRTPPGADTAHTLHGHLLMRTINSLPNHNPEDHTPTLAFLHSLLLRPITHAGGPISARTARTLVYTRIRPHLTFQNAQLGHLLDSHLLALIPHDIWIGCAQKEVSYAQDVHEALATLAHLLRIGGTDLFVDALRACGDGPLSGMATGHRLLALHAALPDSRTVQAQTTQHTVAQILPLFS